MCLVQTNDLPLDNNHWTNDTLLKLIIDAWVVIQYKISQSLDIDWFAGTCQDINQNINDVLFLYDKLYVTDRMILHF